MRIASHYGGESEEVKVFVEGHCHSVLNCLIFSAITLCIIFNQVIMLKQYQTLYETQD